MAPLGGRGVKRAHTQIERFAPTPSHGLPRGRRRKSWKDPYKYFRGTHVRHCDYCGKGGNLYLCDFCDVAVHARCLTKEGLIIPTRSADWACPRCTA